MAHYGNYSNQGSSARIGFEGMNEPPPPYEPTPYGQEYQGFSGGMYPSGPPVAPLQGSYVPPPTQHDAYQPSPTYGNSQSPNVYSNYSPSPSYSAPSYSNYSPQASAQGSSSFGQEHKTKSGGGFLNNIGGFASKNKMEIAGAALSYKMGGGIGKVMAAGMAADLAHKYQKDQKHRSSSQSQTTDAYSGGSTSSHAGVKSPGIAGDLMSTGQQLFGKAQKYAGGYIGGGGMSIGINGKYVEKELETGCVVELVSEVTGRALQIVKGRDGSLVLDALGMDSPQAFNAHFTVIKEADKTIMLHNNNNFVSIVGGRLTLMLGGPPSYQCKFRVHEPRRKTVSLESVAEPGCCVGIAQNGEPNPSSLTRYNDFPAFFTLRTVYDPHQRR